LISGLGGEKENWTKKSIQCKEESKNIVGDVVLSSGIIAYLGAFPINYRKEAIAKWYELLQKNNILVS
jgi:dynein heavy chain